MLIGVIGDDEAEGDALRLAYEVGREIATRGHVLVSGGRGGVMCKSCRGAQEAGGLTVGILPGDDTSDANEFIDIPIITGIGYARNSIVVRTANALIGWIEPIRYNSAMVVAELRKRDLYGGPPVHNAERGAGSARTHKRRGRLGLRGLLHADGSLPVCSRGTPINDAD